jgi:hypothetical protein
MERPPTSTGGAGVRRPLSEAGASGRPTRDEAGAGRRTPNLELYYRRKAACSPAGRRGGIGARLGSHRHRRGCEDRVHLLWPRSTCLPVDASSALHEALRQDATLAGPSTRIGDRLAAGTARTWATLPRRGTFLAVRTLSARHRSRRQRADDEDCQVIDGGNGSNLRNVCRGPSRPHHKGPSPTGRTPQRFISGRWHPRRLRC